jgi:hypothetical protein
METYAISEGLLLLESGRLLLLESGRLLLGL